MSGAHTGQALRTLRHIVAGQSGGGLSDRELLRRFAAGRDEGAFAALVRRHGPMVLATCRRVLHNVHDAEDIFQAAFLTLARKAPAPGWQESVAAWLHLIAYRLALKVRAGAERRTAAGLPPSPRPSPDPLAEVSGRELCAILDEELSGLSETYRAPLVLCCLEGLSRDEAAQRLGWSPGSVKGRLERGRELLRQRLSRRGVALSAGLVGLALAGGARAAVSPGLRTAVIVAALGQGAGASPKVVALAEAALRGSAAGRAKLLPALLLALAAAGAGMGLVGRPPAPADEPPTEAAVADAPKADEARPSGKDLYGDPLPPGAISRLGTTRFRHAQTTYAIAFSPADGKVLATGSLDNTLRLWDTATGKELARFGQQNGSKLIGQVLSVAFSPDGKTVASGSNDGTIRLWDPKTGNVRHEITTPQRCFVAALAFAPDGKSLASAHEEAKGAVVIWDTATGKELRRLEGHEASVTAVAYSADGKRIASGGADTSVRLWDATTGKEVGKFDADTYVNGVALSPDGKLLASCGRGKGVGLWDVATGRQVRNLPFPEESVLAVAFAPDGKTLAAASGDWGGGRAGDVIRGRVLLFDVAGGKVLRRLTEGDHRPVKAVAFSPDGKTVAAVDRVAGPPRLWDVATGKEVRPVGGHQAQIVAAAFTADGRRVLTSAWDETTRVWDVATGEELRRLPGGPAVIRPDGQVLPGSLVHLRPDGKALLTVSGPREPAVHFWDPDTGRELRQCPLPCWDARLAIDAGGTTLALPDEDNAIRLYDLTAGKERGRLAGGEGLLWLTFSADGKRLVSAVPDKVVLWDVATGKEVRTFRGKQETTRHNPFAGSGALSPDGSLLAARCNDARLRVWEAATGQERLELKDDGMQWWGGCVRFSPDGRTLVLGSTSGPVGLWEVAGGKERRRLEGHQGAVDVIAFSGDGRFLVTGGVETAALVWDLRPPAKPLTADGLKAAWADLASDDAARAYQAVLRLGADPAQSVPFLKEALPVARADEKRVIRLITDLDADDFGTREQAAAELEKLGEVAVPALRKALAGRPSAELRLRCEQLLAKLDGPAPSGERLRGLRAVEALELAGTREAVEALRRLAGGAEGALRTREARAALKRLAK